MIEIEKELKFEIEEIKKIIDLLSSLSSIRTAFFYNITNEHAIENITGNMGDYLPFCSIIQQEFRHKCVACDLDHFKKAENRKTPFLYQCYNGLYEMILPLYMEEYLIRIDKI